MPDATESGWSDLASGTPVREALELALERERARTREIDHRAKNSLQLVSSLLLLLSRRAQSDETRRTLQSLQQRIGAIAAVHHGFTDGELVNRFDFTGFLRRQIQDLARGAPQGVTLRLDLDAVDVATSAAVPLALIVTELTTNALAFAGSAATVTVRLRKSGAGLALAVEDDGPGLPQTPGETGFGLTMVRLLSQQIGARLALEDSQPGLRAVVTIS